MIAPGLLLVTGRHDEALSTLRTYAHVSEGMIPNRFDDYGGPPTTTRWTRRCGFIRRRLSTCRARRRTRPGGTASGVPGHYRGVHEGDAVRHRRGRGGRLVFAGDDAPLTWMDATWRRYAARHGKAVEINANALRSAAAAMRGRADASKADELDAMAGRVRALQ